MDRSSINLLLFWVLVVSLCAPSSAQTCDSYRFTRNQVFSFCRQLPVLSSFLHWNFYPNNNTAEIAFRKTVASADNWVAWALNPSQQRMMGSQALFAYRQANGSVIANTTQLNSPTPSMEPGSLTFVVSNLRAEYSNSEMRIFATLQLTDALRSTNQVWQEGPVSEGSPCQHLMDAENLASVGTINFQTGETTGGSNSITRRRNAHGILNAVSWGTLMPLGAIMARYLKVFKAANPAWFYLHVTCQICAYGFGVAGWATGIKLGSDSPGVTHDTHRNIGITIFCLGTLQVFALLLRPKPDHKYRLYWNIYHYAIGYTTIILGVINIYEGFDILDPEKKWKRTYTGIIIALGAAATVLEAFTWLVIIKKKKTTASDKHLSGANGHGSMIQQNV